MVKWLVLSAATFMLGWYLGLSWWPLPMAKRMQLVAELCEAARLAR